MNRAPIPLLLALLAGCAQSASPAAMLDRGKPPPPSVLFERSGARVTVEIAVSAEERGKGLMYRKSLPEGAGMLFVFESEEVHPFWMKNTLIPLDMIFIGSSFEVVDVFENAEPNSTRSIVPASASRYALEVNAGFVRRNGIVPPDRVLFEHMNPRHFPE